METIPLEYGKFYHIYNRGINGCTLYDEEDNYKHFLHNYDKYCSKVADTYAWVLMKNHFHFLVKIKKEEDIPFMVPKKLEDTSGSRSTISELTNEKVTFKKYKPTSQFSHLFNAYAKSINKRYYRTGSLFEHPFKRIPVETRDQLLYLVYYIHHNPIHHRFCNHFLEYPWSSYLTLISPGTTKLKRNEVLQWFNDKQNLVKYHDEKQFKLFKEMEIEFIGDC
jgi:putative transposase